MSPPYPGNAERLLGNALRSWQRTKEKMSEKQYVQNIFYSARKAEQTLSVPRGLDFISKIVSKLNIKNTQKYG